MLAPKFIKKYTIDDLDFQVLDKKCVRETVKILIVDDQKFEYESILRSRGFNITKINYWNTHRDAELYDIIVSDIRGVTPSFPGLKSEGVNMLYQVKNDYPNKICILYTSSPIMPDDNKSLFNGMSMLDKYDDIEDWTNLLDDKIELLRNPKKIWYRIQHYLEDNGASQKFILTKQDLYVRGLKANKKRVIEQVFTSDDASDLNINLSQLIGLIAGAMEFLSTIIPK